MIIIIDFYYSSTLVFKELRNPYPLKFMPVFNSFIRSLTFSGCPKGVTVELIILSSFDLLLPLKKSSCPPAELFEK